MARRRDRGLDTVLAVVANETTRPRVGEDLARECESRIQTLMDLLESGRKSFSQGGNLRRALERAWEMVEQVARSARREP